MPLISVSMGEHLRPLMLTEQDLARLRRHGRVRVSPGPVDAAAEIAITSWDTPRLPDAMPELRFVAHTGGAVRPFIPRALLESGVAVSQASSEMVRPVAEHALALSLVLLRQIHVFDRGFAAGERWPVGEDAGFGRSLHSRRVGVVGASRTGREFIRLVQALGATDVQVADPYLGEEDAERLRVRRSELSPLFRSSDLVAVHAPLTPQTRGMIDASLLALLPDGAVVVNTARAAIFDEEALLDVARSGRVRLGFDVFHAEPLAEDSPLRKLDTVLLTPHVAGATRDARAAQGRFAVAEVLRFLEGEPLRGAIDLEGYDRGA